MDVDDKHFGTALKLLKHNWQPLGVALNNDNNKSRSKMIKIIEMILRNCNLVIYDYYNFNEKNEDDKSVCDNYNYKRNNEDDKSSSYDFIEAVNDNPK